MITATSNLATALHSYHLEQDPKKRSVIFAKEIGHRWEDVGPVLAANSLASLAGDLVAQRALDLLVGTFPVLTSIATNYSSEQARFGQTIITRVITPPAAREFVPADGYQSSDAVTADIESSLDKHKYVQVEFSVDEIGSTGRDLLGEQAEAVLVGLGDDLAAALFSRITEANFPNATTIALVDFKRASIVELGRKLTARKVPQGRRFALLSSAYHAQLEVDDAIVALGTQQDSAIITSGRLPKVSGFALHDVPELPTTGNLKGFAAYPGALSIAVRPANDYATAIPGVPSAGSVSTVQDHRTGLAASLVLFVDHRLARAYMRVAWFYGVGVGQATAGERLLG